MNFINKNKSPNFNSRKKGTSIKYIIIHYTAIINYRNAIDHLVDKKNKVSAHFLINKVGEIYNLVDIDKRAWHAGISYWKGSNDINSESIGIELDNSGHYRNFEEYSSKQIISLIKLLRHICKKYKINKSNILGHSDISPYRKNDPGEKFPWKYLNKSKFGFYPKKHNINNLKKIDNYLEIKLKTKKLNLKCLFILKKIGYDTKPAEKNSYNFKKLIKSYQRHYRQNTVNGRLDSETYKFLLIHFNEFLTYDIFSNN